MKWAPRWETGERKERGKRQTEGGEIKEKKNAV